MFIKMWNPGDSSCTLWFFSNNCARKYLNTICYFNPRVDNRMWVKMTLFQIVTACLTIANSSMRTFSPISFVSTTASSLILFTRCMESNSFFISDYRKMVVTTQNRGTQLPVHLRQCGKMHELLWFCFY